ncbi:MAG: hypothetical protein EAY81_04720 [Bacteroidetes bacterium]|nr:MAG: hypothetical protein EAY81_04720 [Bacteroidota bacterium]
MKKLNWYGIVLLLILFVISFFKDDFTPDYRNTPSALFLSPDHLQASRLSTLGSHWLFWLMALLYTSCFIVLPTAIIKVVFQHKSLTQFTLLLHVCIALALYLCIFANVPAIDMIFVSKVNRYLHSPIITLFLWAAFMLNKRAPQHSD